MDVNTFLWLLTDIILVILILSLIFKWFMKQLRDICRNVSGYVILGQLLFMFLSWGIFLLILFYYIFNPEDVGVLNVFLTIIVGFLGTMIGIFFSDRAFEKIIRDLEERNERNRRIIKKDIDLLNDFKELMEWLKKSSR